MLIAPNFSDNSSFANLDCFQHKHLELELHLSFKSKTLGCRVKYDFTCLKTASHLFLDVNDLLVKSVAREGKECQWQVVYDGRYSELGSFLVVQVDCQAGEKFVLEVSCSTKEHPAITAFNWLEPAQTAGRGHPYFYTQCQPIYCRSIFPCQDSPSCKFTYCAVTTVDLNLPIFLSACLVSEG
jgi:leukotriene-A4 hydrolase